MSRCLSDLTLGETIAISDGRRAKVHHRTVHTFMASDGEVFETVHVGLFLPDCGMTIIRPGTLRCPDCE